MCCSRWSILLSLSMLMVAAACDEEGGPCTVGTSTGCAGGEICQEVVGEDEPACFAPAQIEGRIFDLQSDVGIEDARIVALDADGVARTDVTVSEAEGAYALPVSLPRDAEGQPLMEQVTLRVSASGYLAFPKAPRAPIPVDLGTATFDEEAGVWIVENAATDVGLIALEGDTSGLGSISGSVEIADAAAPDAGVALGVGGVLVIADVGGDAASTAVTDRDGGFALFNVPAGDVTVRAYVAGVSFEPETVTVTSGEETTGVLLTGGAEGLSTVSGTIEYADAACSSTTSVILFPESTFEQLVPGSPTFLRGETPPGLRAADVGTSFSIPNVPPGRYAVLAAFENDCLVRDPDIGIAGTDVVFIDVTGDGSDVDAGSFKVTGALDVVSPGATGLEVVDTATPTLTWAKDPSVEAYELRVFDAFGNLVFENLDVPDPRGGSTVEYVYDGPALEDGMIYQFRVVSLALVSRNPRSTTEDLLGLFRVEL